MYAAELVRHAAGEVRHVARGTSVAHRHLRDRVATIVLVTVVVDLICALLSLWAEQGAKGTDIHSFGTALFWASSQLLTVSSSMANPVTTGGRVLDVFMELYGITVVAGLAGALGAFMIKRAEGEDERPATR